MKQEKEFQEGSYVKFEGVVVKGTEIRKFSHTGNSDAIFPPKGYRKLLFTKVQNFVVTISHVLTRYGITVIRDENGNHWIIIGAFDEK